MKRFTYEETKEMFMKVGKEDWANSRMTGRCGISKKRIEKCQQMRPDVPLEVIVFPEKHVSSSRKQKLKGE